MGGCAYIIYGVVRDETLQAKPTKKGFFGKLFGGSKNDQVQRSSFGDSTLIDVPCGGLSKKMHQGFIEYLGRKFEQPNDATKYVLDAYLGVAKSETYIRGEEKKDSCNWYAQFTFSGCAGMADISAEVCAHWAELWAREHLDDFIRPLLDEYGFEVSDPPTAPRTDYAFIRVNIEGQDTYASMEEDGGIEVDGAFYEELEEDYEQFSERMKKLYANKAELKECECQLCLNRSLSGPL